MLLAAAQVRDYQANLNLKKILQAVKREDPSSSPGAPPSSEDQEEKHTRQGL